jgi:signal transduction histidine kinase
MLQAITDQVAVVISQINLQRQAQQQARCQGLIEQLTIAIRNAQDLSQILNLATTGIAQVLQVERSFLVTLKYADPMMKSRSVERAAKTRAAVVCEWLHQADRNTQTAEEVNELSWLQQSFWVADCAWCQQVFLDPTQPLAIADQQQVLNPDKHFAPIFDPEQFPAALIIPLESQGTVLGFLVLQHHQVRPWQPDEIMWAELVAAQVSTAMIQSQTLRQVQGLVEERTAQLQRSLEVQAKLYERTRRQVDQLRQLNQLKDEFLSTMSHELRTPLTSMTLAIRMLRQPSIAPERHQKYLDILEQQCNQETNLINDLLALQKLESNQAPIQLQKVDLRGLVHDLTACFEDQWTAKGLKLALELPKRSLMVQTDFDSLNRILIELLTNAGKYADPHTTVSLSLTHQIEAGVSQTVMTLRNIGHGISAEELPHIFDKFRRGRGVTQQAIQGTGLGLALVKCLVQHLNGTITVASQLLTETPNRYETCFTLILPSVFHSEAP